MKPARIQADFNELIESDLVLLSQQDIKLDNSGQEVLLFPGKEIDIYMDDTDENGWFRLIYMDPTTSVSEEHHAHACEVDIMFSVIFSETIRWLFVLTPRFEQYPSGSFSESVSYFYQLR